MCGIVGQYNFGSGVPVEFDRLLQMTRSVTHRGPDDEGTYLNGPLGFGFRRLAILDLSPAGHQPMSDPEGSVWVVFNGEIYNFRELRSELEALGQVFRSQCDTEVIVYGYKQWGEAVLNRLNGMFGLAIWDTARHKLILARDPMGIKPVYYAIRNGELYFGSEIRAVLAGLSEKSEVDPVALNLFLRYRYTPSPWTLFRGIRKLAAGEMLIVRNEMVQSTRWYRYDPQPLSPTPSDEEATEAMLDIYKRAVKRHLISDVPLGLLLSGGIDSGLLLGLMNLYGNSWPTFTVGYGSLFKDDELTDAAETARIYSARHTAVQLDQQTFVQTLPRIVGILEEPIASSSIVPMYFVCQRARQDVKVALIGQGPDELFGGYTRHLGVHYGRYWRQLPKLMRALLSRGIRCLPRNESLKRAMYSIGLPDRINRYQNVFSLLPGDAIDALFQESLLPSDAGNKILESWQETTPIVKNLDELNGFQLLELRSSLPDELLMYADKLSMIHALEVRVPYLDREVVEFVQRLKASFKVRLGSRKWLHRQVCQQFLPGAIMRRKKRGFAVNVVDAWFHKTMSNQMEEYFREERSLMYQYLKPNRVQQLLHEHRTGRNDNHKILFSLIVFEQWLRAA